MVMTTDDIYKALDRCDAGTGIELQLLDDATGVRRALEVDRIDLTLLGARQTLTVVVYDPAARTALQRDTFCRSVADGVLSRIAGDGADPEAFEARKREVREAAVLTAWKDFDAGDIDVASSIEHALATLQPANTGDRS